MLVCVAVWRGVPLIRVLFKLGVVPTGMVRLGRRVCSDGDPGRGHANATKLLQLIITESDTESYESLHADMTRSRPLKQEPQRKWQGRLGTCWVVEEMANNARVVKTEKGSGVVSGEGRSTITKSHRLSTDYEHLTPSRPLDLHRWTIHPFGRLSLPLLSTKTW